VKKGYGYRNGVSCPNCLSHFGSDKSLEKHSDNCFTNSPQKVIVPPSGETIEFSKYHKKYRVPFIAFLDFEATQNQPDNKCETCSKKKLSICPHKTIIKSIQKPITYSLLILNEKNEVIHKNTYSGEACVDHLIDTLLSMEEKLKEYMQKNIPMSQLTPAEESEKENAVVCHICEKDLGEDRVTDHNHLDGKFIGMAHSSCNLNRKTPRFIPVFAHNLQGYDSHFLVNNMRKDERIYKMEGLPHNTERFKTITINCFMFLDSMAFLSASLNELVNNLTKNKNHEFSILNQMELYKEKEGHLKRLLLRKGVYPYDFATSIDILKDTKELPPIEKFYSLLTNNTISEEDHDHAVSVFKAFKCDSMLSYTELYCQTDTGKTCICNHCACLIT
jgi:hypothetical protein